MRRWLKFDSGRRGFLGAGLLAAGGAVLSARSASGQTEAPGHQGMHEAAPAAKAGGKSDHRMAHGAMTTVGDVDNERNGFDPTAMLTDWYTGTVSTAARRPHAQDLRADRGGQGDRDRSRRHVPGLDLQRSRARAGAAGGRGRPAAHRLPQQWIAPAFDAFPRHPFGAHGRRAGRRPDRSGRGIRLRIRRQAVRLPSLSLPCAAAGAAHAQGDVRDFRHRSRSRPPPRASRRRALAPARHARKCRNGRKWRW